MNMSAWHAMGTMSHASARTIIRLQTVQGLLARLDLSAELRQPVV